MAEALMIMPNELDLSFAVPEDTSFNDEGSSHFIEEIKRLNRMPFNKGDIFWSDDVWDFAPYTKLSIPKKTLKFIFSKCPEMFKDELKSYVLIQLLNKRMKIQSIHKNATYLRKFFTYAFSEGYCYVEDIPDSTILGYLHSEIEAGLLATTLAYIRGAIKSFYRYYSVNFKDIFTSDRQDLLETSDVGELYAVKEAAKTPDIPNNFFRPFMKAVIQIAHDESMSLTDRAMACIYILLSQTGLRIGELLNLEVDDITSTLIFSGERTYYLRYKTWKRVKGNNAFTYEKTFINELSKFAFDMLADLYESDRNRLGTKMLFLGGARSRKTGAVPIESNTFDKMSVKFFFKLNDYFPTVNVPDGTYIGVPQKNVTSEKFIKQQHPEVKTIARPRNHQFRVHVCTELYNKGVPIEYINKYMAHLSTQMEDYYIRITPKNPQEDMEFSYEVMKKVVSGDLHLLGGKDVDGMMKKINDFIADNKFNVKKDIDAICQSLLKQMPIRPKTGGVCIKSSIRECSIDAKTDDFYCAYGVCPNLFHFFYVASLSYRQYKEMREAIDINRKNGFTRQAQKETHRLANLISTKLVPELDELRKEVESKGVGTVLEQYPDLTEVVENFDDIYSEVTEWKSKNS